MTTTLEQTLDGADRAWRDGLLVEAQTGYQRALQLDPTSWHAAFQLAWLDSATGPVAPDRVRALDSAPASAESAALLDELRDRAEPDWDERAPGTLRDWDLLVLRTSDQAGDAHWWEERARACAEALPNAALACWQEAAILDPGRYYKQPHAMGVAWSRTQQHIDELQAASGRRLTVDR